MSKQFRLMKPADLKGTVEGLKFPIYATPKYDGIRFGTKLENRKVSLFSNSLKPIANLECQRIANHYLEAGYDGEIILLDQATLEPLPFYQVSSYVMSADKTLKEYFPGAIVSFKIFDIFTNPEEPYSQRYKKLSYWHRMLRLDIDSSIDISPCYLIKVENPEEALKAHEGFIQLGFEATVFRSPKGLYKFNRSTLKEQFSLKLKPFEDSEATLVEVEPYYENLNDSKPNERGYKEKSKTLADRKALDMLGAMIVDSPEFGLFKIGTGFTHEQRKEIWDNQDLHRNKLVKYKFMRGGAKDKPRHPVFLGFRDPEDL